MCTFIQKREGKKQTNHFAALESQDANLSYLYSPENVDNLEQNVILEHIINAHIVADISA